MKKSTLIIKGFNDDFERFFSKKMTTPQVDVVCPFRNCYNIVDNVLFIITKKLMLLRLLSFWIGPWKKNINQYSIIIVFDSVARPSLIKWIKKHAKCRLILWWWNVPTNEKTLLFYKKYCECVCFDEKKAKEKGMRFVQQFYIPNYNINSVEIEYDVIYVGYDKQRYKIIQNLAAKFSKLNLLFDFNLIRNNVSDYTDELGIKIRGIPIEYTEIIGLIQKSKAILELNLSVQEGITLRALESLFYEKKLITNNSHIKKFDFYCRENIFILGEDNLNDLNLFLKTKYKKLDNSVKVDYMYDHWLESILQVD